MNPILSNIYGTAGLEKVASAEMPSTLSDLATLIAHQDAPEGDLEKIASVHNAVLDNLVAFDRAGRAVAHQEFAGMEKMASEGNVEALEEFFATEEEESINPEDLSALKSAVVEELERRTSL